MKRIVAAAIAAVLCALFARPAFAQHDECYLSNSGMSGPSRCLYTGIVGTVSTDVCVLSGIYGNFHQCAPTGQIGGDEVLLSWISPGGGGPYWAMTLSRTSTSDKVAERVSCVPSSRFSGGATSTSQLLYQGNPNLPFLWAPNNISGDMLEQSFGVGAAYLCSLRGYSGAALSQGDLVATQIQGGTWNFQVWGNPDAMIGEAGCVVSGSEHYTGQYWAGPTSPVGLFGHYATLPPATQALCAITQVGGALDDPGSSAFIFTGSDQSQTLYVWSGNGQPLAATVQCAYFQ
jgi:hypothetical protein